MLFRTTTKRRLATKLAQGGLKRKNLIIVPDLQLCGNRSNVLGLLVLSMPKISPLSTLSELQTVSLDKDNLVVEQISQGVEDIDYALIQSFDAAWLKILQDRGSLIGKHERKIASLQCVASKFKKSKEDIKSELKKQTFYVRSNRDEMEAKFKEQKLQTISRQEIDVERRRKDMDLIVNVSESADKTIRWNYFIQVLNRLVASSDDATCRIKSAPSYSDQAVCLIDLYQMDTPRRDTNVARHRTSKVENALLKARLQILTLDLKRYQEAALLKQSLDLHLDSSKEISEC
jgi:hypothetical protein